MKILFCVDGSEYSDYALDYAGKMWGDSFEATIMYVSPDLESIYGQHLVPHQNLSEEIRNMSGGILENASAILKKYHIKTNVKEHYGNVADQIINETENHDYNLVVVGSHGSSGLSTFVLGSVSTKVLCSVKIPVLVVKKSLQASEN